MRIAGLDISKNTVGIAFSDEDLIFVAFETTLKTKNYNYFRKKLKEVFSSYKPEITYVGLPKLNDQVTQTTILVKTFMHNIRDIVGKFEFVDESFSTVHAKHLIEENQVKIFHSVDSLVAKMIVLQKIQQNNAKQISEQNL
jgi:RNase H-fold protein (predicted Holliday junction resolvase)